EAPLGVARPHVGGGGGGLAGLADGGDGVGAGGVHGLGQLLEGGLGVLDGGGGDGHADEDDALPEGPFDEAGALPAVLAERATVRVGRGVAFGFSHGSPRWWRCRWRGRPAWRWRPRCRAGR